MFWRSYDITYGEHERKHYLSDVYLCLTKFPWCMRENERPYDRFKDKKVKTIHYVVWYDTNKVLAVDHIRSLLLSQGFFLQENPTQEKSVREIEHFHALKILSRQ